MALNARERLCKSWISKSFDRLGIKEQFRSRPFPDTPRARSFDTDFLVIASQPSIISTHHIVALIFRNNLDELFPHVRKDPTCAFLIEPLDLFRPAEKNPAQHHFRRELRIGLSIIQR